MACWPVLQAAHACICRGKRGSRLLDEVQILNTSTGEWQSPELVDGVHPSARYGPMLACVQGQVCCCTSHSHHDSAVHNDQRRMQARLVCILLCICW